MTQEPRLNTPDGPEELTVSEISQRLKAMVEGTFYRVRVRGELSRVVLASSGHMYTDLKDTNAVLNAVCWRGTVPKLSVKPEEGLEVIVTGKLTTYPSRSNYQIVIESMELAGEGALLKLLEERRKKLAAEGLFDDSRKKPIPYLPEVIGVITSPTGAVIRDILHRLSDRFPRPVYLWPVTVQGDNAAQDVIAGIKGFNALPVDSPYRPDVLIVARGGGSLEDLMPFNDEALVRAVSASNIPVISAVGHETDTTLCDFAADLRAPTPTAAAEKAVPVRADLHALVLDRQKRLISTMQRVLDQHKKHIEGLSRGLIHPRRLLETIQQKLDYLGLNLERAQKNLIPDRARQLEILGKLLESYSFERVLERGFVLVQDLKGKPLMRAADAETGQNVRLRFSDGERDAIIDGKGRQGKLL